MLSVNGLLLQVNKANEGKILSKIKMAVTTEVNEINLSSSCRVCLMQYKSSDLFCLFGTNSVFQDLSIATALLDCFNINLEQNDKLPNYVCKNCASSTLQSYTFKRCILKCQEYLSNKPKIRHQNKSKNGSLLYKRLTQLDENQKDDTSDAQNYNDNTLEKSPTNPLVDHNYNKENATNIITKDIPKLTDPKLSESEKCEKETNESISQNNHLESSCIDINASEIFNADIENKKLPTCSLNTAKKLTKSQSERKKREFKVIDDRWWLKEMGPPYQCQVCGKNYGVQYRPFYMHVRAHRVKKSPCIHCGKRFTRDRMIIHLRCHTKEKPYICDQCPARFTIEGNLKRHFRAHTGEKRYVCDICGKAFTQSNSLNGHKELHSNETFMCEYCGVQINSKIKYRLHLNQQHKKLDNINSNSSYEKKIYECNKCNRTFKTQGGLNLHSTTHSDQNTTHFRCHQCYKFFRSKLNYDVHKLWHKIKEESLNENTMKFDCEICFDDFSNSNDLEKHVLSHMERNYSCVKCKKRFVTKGSLMNHIRQYHEDKIYNCTMCIKSFRNTTTLRQHLKVHTGEKPYECDVCKRRFAQQQQVVSHMFTHTGEKKYVCPYCGKAFALNGNLTVHKRRHTGETPYVCNVCSKGFYDSSSLKKHKNGHSKFSSKNNLFMEKSILLKEEQLDEIDVMKL